MTNGSDSTLNQKLGATNNNSGKPHDTQPLDTKYKPHSTSDKPLDTLVIASHNQGKIREITALLSPYGTTVLSAQAMGLAVPEENGNSFADNALIKARASAKATTLAALADDSGLCVAALGGRPGIYTADWAERQSYEGAPGRDWYLAMGKVEGLLAEISAQGTKVDRHAHFTCALALAWPDGDAAVFEGQVRGSLTWPPRGRGGFGYDPIFIPEGYSETFGELNPILKDKISHRSVAFAKLIAQYFG